MAKDGGPAFPKHLDECGQAAMGMTLRQYYAAKAMQALITRSTGDFLLLAAATADDAFTMADAMIQADNG